jgi:acyl carrier protein
MTVIEQVQEILRSVLQLSNGGNDLVSDPRLLGAIPEFDSMAVVSVLTALEDHYGFFITDDEIDANVFETVGTLVNFVEQKLNKG